MNAAPGPGIIRGADSSRKEQKSMKRTLRIFSFALSLVVMLSSVAKSQPQASAIADGVLSQNAVMKWFKPGLTRWDVTGPVPVLPWPGNRVTELIDGWETFKAMRDAIRTARGPGSYVYLLGWWLSDDFRIDPDDAKSTMTQLLADASRSGAEVRAMLWLNKSAFPAHTNLPQVVGIRQLPGGNGWAILDNRTLNFGSHHQKVLIVKGSEGLVAF